MNIETSLAALGCISKAERRTFGRNLQLRVAEQHGQSFSISLDTGILNALLNNLLQLSPPVARCARNNSITCIVCMQGTKPDLYIELCDARPFHSRGSFSEGSMPGLRFAANVSMLFKESGDLLKRFESAKQAGFKAVECGFPYNETPEELKTVLQKTGLQHVLINGYPGICKNACLFVCDVARFKRQNTWW